MPLCTNCEVFMPSAMARFPFEGDVTYPENDLLKVTLRLSFRNESFKPGKIWSQIDKS